MVPLGRILFLLLLSRSDFGILLCGDTSKGSSKSRSRNKSNVIGRDGGGASRLTRTCMINNYNYYKTSSEIKMTTLVV